MEEGDMVARWVLEDNPGKLIFIEDLAPFYKPLSKKCVYIHGGINSAAVFL